MSTTTTTHSKVAVRIGLILAVLLAALQIQTGIGLALNEGEIALPMLLIGCAAIALVAVVLAWRGSSKARVVAAVATVAPTLTGISAFFQPDLPAAVLAFVSLGVVIALVAAALILVPRSATA